MNKDKPTIHTWLIILIIVVILLGYILTLGQVGGDSMKVPDELSESRAKAKHRHRRLEELISRQIELKTKLERKFKRVYFGVRMTLVLIWAGIAASLHALSLLQSVDDFLSYSEFSVLILITLHFVTFGSLKNVNEFIDSIKRRTENWVYGKYVDIDSKIESNKKRNKRNYYPVLRLLVPLINYHQKLNWKMNNSLLRNSY